MNISDPISLSQLIPLREKFTRSSRIDDSHENGIGLIQSNSFDIFLLTLAQHQLGTTPQGAYTCTGPYGSGKSTLAHNLLSFLQGSPRERDAAIANYRDETRNALLAAFFTTVQSWVSIPIVGARQSFESVLRSRLVSLGIISANSKPTTEDIVFRIEDFIRKNTNTGIILVVDEMGKFLEYAVNNDGDVYLYQLLAETAARSNGKFVMIGILHQSIQEYAAKAIKSVRDEWSKVQGRFADISLNLNSSEQIELISNVINFDSPTEHHKMITDRFVKYLSGLKRTSDLGLPKLLWRCWPLNPLTAYILGPLSKRSYGQNQRSIFTFLSSGEPLGFRSYLDNNTINTVEYSGFSLSNLWDYLNLNWSGLISASQDSHSFSIAKEALDQLDAKFAANSTEYPILVSMLKCIHLLELTRHETGFNANQETIGIALGVTKDKIQRSIETLVAANLVSMRSHNGSIFLHEGSDFDIDLVLGEELERQNSIDVERLGREFLNSKVIAKRHYFETGSMRWADIAFVNLEEDSKKVDTFVPNSGHFARFIVNLGSDPQRVDQYIHDNEFRQHFAVSSFNLSNVDYDTIREFAALIRISEERAELSKDKIARREVYDRIDLRRQQIGILLSEKLHDATWDVPALDDEMNSESLSQMASDIADALFDQALVVKNELVNRMKVSASANRATKQFLYDLIEREGQENLGYISFPPERAIFETILKEYQLYSHQDGSWKIADPAKVNNERAQSLAKLFEQTLGHLKMNKDRQVGLVEIYDTIWSKPPYGIKGGLLPIFAFLFVKVHAAEVVYYQDGSFSPQLTQVDADFFVKSAKYCSLRYMNFDLKTENLLVALAEIPKKLGRPSIGLPTPLNVARALISIFDSVASWTKKSAKVSHNAKAVRGLFARATDPAQLTLIDIPNLFVENDHRDEASVQLALKKVEEALAELLSFQESVLHDLRQHLLNELGIYTVTPLALKTLNERAQNVRKMAGDNRMETFIMNLSQLSTDLQGIEKIASMLVNKPAKLWIDNDVDRLFIEATNYARNFNTLETMGHIRGRKSSRKALSLILHNNGEGRARNLSIELNSDEVEMAIKLSERVLSILDEENFNVGPREMIAALAFLLEGDNSDV